MIAYGQLLSDVSMLAELKQKSHGALPFPTRHRWSSELCLYVLQLAETQLATEIQSGSTVGIEMCGSPSFPEPTKR
jgi:hypothetical protein